MATAAPTIGMQLGPYRLVREIGRGAMATVYEAEHAALRKRVALKAMHPHHAANETSASRFVREGRAAAQIRSRHVVEVFDVGVHAGTPYLVMELLEGRDLAVHLRDRGRLPLPEIAAVMLPVLSAVAAAHDAGVIHRDLKPSNVFLAATDAGPLRPTVVDFGISKIQDEIERDLTTSEVILGTVHYMSPEQTRGARNASVKSDVYAAGVMLYELATGRKPFAGVSPYALMHAIVSARVVPPSGVVRTLPAAFDELVLGAMHRDPDRRPSVRALAARLVRWASPADRARWGTEFDAADMAPAGASVRSRARVGGVLAVAVALGAAVVVSRVLRQTDGSSAPPSTTAEQAQSIPGLLPAPPPAEPPRTLVPDPAPAPEPALAPASAPAPAPASAPPRSPGRPRPAPAHAPPLAPSATASAAADAAERGTNGAFILE